MTATAGPSRQTRRRNNAQQWRWGASIASGQALREQFTSQNAENAANSALTDNTEPPLQPTPMVPAIATPSHPQGAESPDRANDNPTHSPSSPLAAPTTPRRTEPPPYSLFAAPTPPKPPVDRDSPAFLRAQANWAAAAEARELTWWRDAVLICGDWKLCWGQRTSYRDLSGLLVAGPMELVWRYGGNNYDGGRQLVQAANLPRELLEAANKKWAQLYWAPPPAVA